MNKKELFYWVGKCLALDERPEFRNEIIQQCKSELIDWDEFVSLCSNYLILPVIYLKFRSQKILEHIPVELAEHLREIYELNVVRNNQILSQVREITSGLNKENIYPVFLKGVANLLDGLYSDAGERIMSDIDFLVSEEEYLVAAQLMKGIGYEEVAETPAYTDVKSLKHYPRLFRSDCVANIEIHRIPVNQEYVSWFNTEKINQEKISVDALTGCFVSSDRHKIIHNFIHSQLSNEGHLFGTVSLRGIYDLLLLSKRVSLEETIPQIKTKQKAIAYFAFSGAVLGLNKSFYSRKNLAFHVFTKKHTLNLNSTFFNNTHRSLIFISQRVFIGYFGQFFKAFYSKEKREYLSKRIVNRSWYGNHVRLYTRFFKMKK